MILLTLLACPGPVEPSTETCEACDGGCVEEAIPSVGAEHVEGLVDYADYPPTSGDHDLCWATWGVHDDTVPAERWVHNLEHGGVVFLHAANADAADVSTLRTWAAGLPEGRALVTVADAQMQHPFAAVAWQHRLQLDCMDTDALQAFFDAHMGNAPEDVDSDPGESCL